MAPTAFEEGSPLPRHPKTWLDELQESSQESVDSTPESAGNHRKPPEAPREPPTAPAEKPKSVTFAPQIDDGAAAAPAAAPFAFSGGRKSLPTSGNKRKTPNEATAPSPPPPKGSARREEEQNEAGPRRSVLPLPHFQPVLLRELPLRQSRASLLKLLAGGLQPMPQLAAPPRPLPPPRQGQVQDAAPPAAPRGEGGARRGHQGRPRHRCRRRLVGCPPSRLPDPSRLLGGEEAGRQRSRPVPPPGRSPSTCGRWD